jgi:hypothetical protein
MAVAAPARWTVPVAEAGFAAVADFAVDAGLAVVVAGLAAVGFVGVVEVCAAARVPASASSRNICFIVVSETPQWCSTGVYQDRVKPASTKRSLGGELSFGNWD